MSKPKLSSQMLPFSSLCGRTSTVMWRGRGCLLPGMCTNWLQTLVCSVEANAPALLYEKMRGWTNALSVDVFLLSKR